MKTQVLVFTLFLSIPAFGQATFSKLYGFEDQQVSNNSFTSILLDGDSLVLFGNCRIPTDSIEKPALLFVKMDTSGQVGTVKLIQHPNGFPNRFVSSSDNAAFKTSDGGYVMVGNNSKTNSAAFMKISKEGEILIYKEYTEPDGYSSRVISRAVEYDNGFFLSGSGFTDAPKAFVINLDKAGNKKWVHAYNEPNNRFYIRTLIKINDNHFVFGGAKTYGRATAPFYEYGTWSHPWLVEMDSLGNVLSSQEGPFNHNSYITGLKPMQDGWLFGAADFNVLNKDEFGTRTKLVRTGKDMNEVVWEKYIGTTSYSGNYIIDVQPSSDGNWVGISQEKLTYSPVYAGNQTPSTFKFSSDGDIIWSRRDTFIFDPKHGYNEKLAGVVTLPSGSVFVVGSASSTSNVQNRTFGWVLKISNDGCIDTICANSDRTYPNFFQKRSVISPNPTSGRLTVKDCMDCSMKVYDLSGVLIHEKHHLNPYTDLSFLRDGIYIVHIYEKDQLIQIEKLMKTN